MDGASGTIRLAPGARVFVHQAFTCCPYAAVITSKIHDFFAQNGCPVSEHPSEAALSVINTCGFNGSRSRQGIKAIGAIRHLAPASPLVVAGCLTRIERERVHEALAGSPAWLTIGPTEHQRFDGLLAPLAVPFAEVRTNLYKDRYSSRDPRMGLYQVLVSTGCLNQCSYCVIRQAKGSVTSKPLAAIRGEVERGFAEGYRDLFLVGDDIASWGADQGTTVVELLRGLVEIGTDERYSAEAFEPARLMAHIDEALPAFATGRFAWIVLPVQAGSDRLLSAMGRAYTVAEATALVRRLKDAAPDMLVSTDFIFGFAEESRAEFEQSLELAQIFDYANFNEYEPRPGTPPLLVPEDEMAFRRAAVVELLRHQGSQVQVLTRNRTTGCEVLMDMDTPQVGKVEPSPWVVEHGAKLTELFATEAALAAGWAVAEIRQESNRLVVVVASGEEVEPLEFMVTARDADAPCLAFSAHYNLGLIWEKEAPCELDEGQSQAIEALRARLDMATPT